eukprot:scaffold267204_cov35-Attheya_sp.AAC.1
MIFWSQGFGNRKIFDEEVFSGPYPKSLALKYIVKTLSVELSCSRYLANYEFLRYDFQLFRDSISCREADLMER